MRSIQPLYGDDVLDQGSLVVTDPLRRDTDSDQVADGQEVAQGGNPTDPTDGQDFRDTDQDGLSDAEERLGWYLQVNGASAPGAIGQIDPEQRGQRW